MYKLVKKLFWHLPGPILLVLIRIRFINRFTKGTKINYGHKLYSILQPQNKTFESIYMYQPSRLSRYFIGIDERIKLLLEEYLIHKLDSRPGPKDNVVIDIGSNIGEFCMGMESVFPNQFNYIRFEPSENENLASNKNLENISQILIPKALWKEVSTIPFYDKNQTGDSSLFRPDEKANMRMLTTSTLDLEISKLSNFDSIFLVKLEAEGAEPEIVLGGKQVLKKVKYVCADLGPERGMEKSTTISECSKLLFELNFRIIAKNPGDRKCYLFKNQEIL